MVRIPKCLKGLLTNLCVCGCVHEKHAEEHDMPCYSSSLSVVDLDCGNGANLRLFDVEEVHVMGGDVDDRVDKHRVCDLAMKPLRLVEGKEPDLWSDPSQQIPAHGQQNHSPID